MPAGAGRELRQRASADPAVPDAAAQKPVLRKPLYEARGAERSGAPARPCDAGCGGFDPFAWLARLFGGGDDGAETAAEDTAAPPGPVAAPPAVPDPADGDLRTGEVIGRIWIAPFVDADGVYREAFHVRAVLEPAGWRLP